LKFIAVVGDVPGHDQRMVGIPSLDRFECPIRIFVVILVPTKVQIADVKEFHGPSPQLAFFGIRFLGW
jgi:hypothetical protein